MSRSIPGPIEDLSKSIPICYNLNSDNLDRVLTKLTLDVGVVAEGDLEVGVAQGEVGALIVQHTPPAPEPVTMLSFHFRGNKAL